MSAKQNPIVKTAIIGGVVIVGLFAVTIIVRKIIRELTPEDEKKFAKDIINASKKEMRNKYLSYTESEYSSMADSLQEAMLGRGTDESTIYRIVGKLKTPDDWKKLVIAFGMKDIGSYTISSVDRALPSALNEELDDEEMEYVRKLLATINVTI